VIRRRHLGMAAGAASLALLLAGCAGGGGGGGSADESADAPLPAATMPVASGAGPAESASLAIAALGAPGSVDTSAAGATLTGFDRFGTPHDAFGQQVDTTASSGSEAIAGEAPALPADTPINGDPLVPVPAGTGAVPSDPAADPSAGVPVQNPVALEADFDISGEPVVAREGDAIPPDTQQFVVERILSDEVVLKLSGGLLPDGTDTVTLSEGESITLYNATAKRSYKLKLVDVRVV
jgi:hypothetical protein